MDAVTFSAAAMLVVAAVLVSFGRPAVRAILPPGTPDQAHVVALAWQLVIIGACCLPADGMQNVAMGCLRGSGFGRLTLVGALIGYWLVGIPLAWWLGEHHGLGAVGVWVGVGAGLHVSAAILLFLVYRTRWTYPEKSNTAIGSAAPHHGQHDF